MTDAGRDTAWPVQGTILTGIVAIFALVGGLGTWGSVAKISGATITAAQVQSPGGRRPAEHPRGGSVAALFVENGSRVEEGDLLIELDGSDVRVELTNVQAQLDDLNATKARLNAELSETWRIEVPVNAGQVLRDKYRAEDRLMRARLTLRTQGRERRNTLREQLKSQRQGLRGVEVAQREALALLQQDIAVQEDLLARGLTQAPRVLQLRREEAELNGRLAETHAAITALNSRMAEIALTQNQQEAADLEARLLALRDAQNRERDLRTRRARLRQALTDLGVYAPVSGIVHGMQVTRVNEVLRPGQPALYITPLGSEPVIMTDIDPAHADRVRLGQPVRIRLPGLDQTTTPDLWGVVSYLSSEAVESMPGGSAAFAATISLSAAELARLPEDVTLLPGMPAEAFILNGDRTPISYLSKPFTDYLMRAFRGG